MNLNNFQQIINASVSAIENQSEIKLQGAENGTEHIPVVIYLSEPSIGGAKTVEVTAASLGFDWDSGKYMLFPEKDLVTSNYEKKQAKKIQSRDHWYCQNCMTIVGKTDKFCKHCGKKF